jgi:hypothetical protein
MREKIVRGLSENYVTVTGYLKIENHTKIIVCEINRKLEQNRKNNLKNKKCDMINELTLIIKTS